MDYHFVFCHGWGFGNRFWNNIQKYFVNYLCTYLDLGYFSQESKLLPIHKNTYTIGIGHSLGFKKLLSMNVQFKAMVGIHGFIDFLGSEKKFRQRRLQELDSTKKSFIQYPKQTLLSFYKKCGINSPEQDTLEKLNKNKLYQDLEQLSIPVKLSDNIPVLIISSRNDVIVPLKLIDDNFKRKRNITLILHEQYNHILGYENPALVYRQIMSFIDGINKKENSI